MASPFLNPLPRKRKGPDEEITKNVVVLKSHQVHEKNGVVFMPNTTLDMSAIKKSGQSKKITFTKSTSPIDMQRKLEEMFPFLSEASERFYCAKAVERRSKLDFCGCRCIWSGAIINKNITGNSALYIYCEEEKVGDSGHYSSDSDLSGANSSGNCLVIEASHRHKRFRGEPSSATEGLRETFVEVESQKWDTVTNNNRNYTFGGQLDGVKINSTPYSKQAQGVRTCSTTQVTEKEASVCAVTVERQQHQWIMLSTSDTEEEQIQVSDQFSTDPEESGAHITLPPVCSNTSDLTKMVPMTLPLALQPTLPKGDLMEGKQMISSTVLSQLKSLDISGKDKEFQNSHEQVHTETFPAKGNLSGQLLGQPSYLKTQVSAKEASVSAVAKDNQQHTPVTVGASDDKIVELLASFEDEIHSGLISPQGGANSPALDSMNVGSIEEWLKQYDYEVSINPTESPLQGGGPCIFTFKPELPSGVNVKATFGNLEPNILEKTSLGYICKIPASPEMTPNVISVLLISTTTGKILAETFIEYCEVEKGGIWQTIQRITSDPNLQRILLTQLLLYMQSNLGGKPGTCGSGKRGDGSSDGGPSGGGASGGGAYGGGSSGEGPRGSGASGDGTGGTGVSGCGSNGCGAFGSGATRCQYSRGASQPGSDAVWELCELIQKCSVCIWRQNPSTTHNKACTEDEEDLEDDQLLMIHQPSDENYFADTEDYSSVSSESDSALSDSENWDESLSDSSLSFPWVNSRSRKSQKAIAKTESTEHFYKAVNSELNVSLEILTALTEGLNSEISIGEDESHCLEWNTHLSGSKKTEENDEKDDHNEKLDSSQECALCYEASTSHTLLASQDNTLMLCIDVPALNVENEESQYQDDEFFETLHTENAKPQQLESILSVTSNQQSTTHTGPVTQKAARSPLSNPLWIGIGDSKLNMASPQCSDEEIHSGHEWKESGLASWFDLCENEDAEKNEPSRWEMSSMEPNKTDGGVEKDVFDSEQDLSQEQRFFSEKGNLDIHLSSPDDTSVQSLGPEVENKESQLYVDIQLAHAASNGDARVARLLIKNGADVNKEGENPLLTAAAKNGHRDIVRLLIENGADVNKEGGGILKNTPLTAAAENGHTDIVRLLIENGADVNNGRGWIFWITPLTAAAENGHTDIVRLLIENGANVNKRGLVTPLTAAAQNGHTDIVRLLIENGADVNKGGGKNPLTAAAQNGHTDILRLLIENGADVNKGGWICKNTPLTAAAGNGHADIVRLLIENGADVNKEGECIWKNTPLTAAAGNGDTDIVRLLIENGADVNKEGECNTPLTAAVENGHTHIVRLLIENGANVNKRRWSTVLTAAAKNGHTDIVRLLIENGADVNEGGWICKNSPLTAAAENGHPHLFWLLRENGADVSIEGLFVIKIVPLVDRRNFEADARDTKLSLERHIDVQLRGKKVASLPKRPGKKLKTQTEMTSPRDIIEESKCGKDSMTDVELGLNCLHLSPRCEQFKPCIMEELPGDSSIMRHDFKPISKRMDRVTLRDVDNAKQGHCIVVEVAKTHPSGSIIYGIKINEEGSGVLGEPFQLATKDLKDTWEDEEVKAENVQIGSVFKYVQVGDEFVFQGNTKRPRQNVDKILLDLSCAGGSCRDIRDAYSYAEISSERIHQDCASKETLCFISIKCSEIQNESISFVAKLGELLNLKLNCREHFMLHRSPSALQLIDGEEPHLITGDDGSSKPWDQAICEGLVPKNEPREISFDKKPDDEAEETDDDINN